MAGALTGLIGGGGGTIGGAVVRLVLDSSQFNAGLASAEGKLKGVAAGMQAVGTKVSAIGGTLTRSVTLPLVAAGAVATKMALDFNKAFVQIQTLASKGGMSIEQMKTQVLALAQATGQDPNGLATALYQVLSAGKAAASQAFPILTAAAKGAALGMGSVQDVAKILTTTMNAYGPANISAGQAMDVLTQATHDSAAEADALASSLGPVIGIAAQVGVSFQDMTAALATATNQGITAERAATGLRFLLQSLAAPTTAAKDALDRYGISLQDLQRMVAQQGLTGTLQTLAKTFDLTSIRGQQAWKAVVGGARGAIVANTLVGKQAAAAADEVQRLGDAAGVTNKKFELWGQTITGKNAIALGKLKVAAIKLGQDLIPIFEKVVNTISTIVDAFNSLPGPMQDVVVKGLLIAALAGPFLKLAGIVLQLAGAFKGLSGAAGAAGGLGQAAGQLSLFGDAAAGAATGTIALTVAGAALVPVLGFLAVKSIDAATGAQTVRERVVQLQHALAAGTISQHTFAIEMRQLGPQAGIVAKELAREAAATNQVRNQSDFASKAIGNVANQVERAAGSFVKAGHATGAVVHGVQAVGNAATGAAGDMAKASGSANTLTGSINKIPKSHNTKITADANQAIAAAHAAAAALNAIPRSITSVVTTVAHQVTTAAGHMATGGIIHGATGFVTRSPTYMVGEGSYSTFAGKGAEAVIPLNTRGIDILSKAMQKAGGGRSINVTINTQGNFNEQTLAASVSRHLARTIREEALV